MSVGAGGGQRAGSASDFSNQLMVRAPDTDARLVANRGRRVGASRGNQREGSGPERRGQSVERR